MFPLDSKHICVVLFSWPDIYVCFSPHLDVAGFGLAYVGRIAALVGEGREDERRKT